MVALELLAHRTFQELHVAVVKLLQLGGYSVTGRRSAPQPAGKQLSPSNDSTALEECSS
jgi:hypothetical protein